MCDNFRDVAGTGEGYAVPGGHLRRYTIYRSGQLEVDGADLAFLESLGIVAVHDLRLDEELVRHPDAEIRGARREHHHVDGIPITAELRDADETHTCMVDGYRSFVTDPVRRRGFASVLRAVAETEGPQLLHCAGGKDRTGWAVALLQHVAGLDREAILHDYMLTNEYAAASQEALRERFHAEGGDAMVATFEPALGVLPEYLDAALAEADAAYGGTDAYLRDGLALEDHHLMQLREQLHASDRHTAPELIVPSGS